MVTVGYALKQQAAEAHKTKYPKTKKPGRRNATTMSVTMAKATGAPIRSGPAKPKKLTKHAY